MSKPTEPTNEEKKSCRDCAYRRTVAFGGKIDGKIIQGTAYCRQKSPSFNEKDLENNVCEKFLRKKIGLTLEQQLEEQKQEETKKQQLAEQERIKKEHRKLSNRLKRNWYYVTALTIALIGLLITIWKLVLGK